MRIYDQLSEMMLPLQIDRMGLRRRVEGHVVAGIGQRARKTSQRVSQSLTRTLLSLIHQVPGTRRGTLRGKVLTIAESRNLVHAPREGVGDHAQLPVMQSLMIWLRKVISNPDGRDCQHVSSS